MTEQSRGLLAKISAKETELENLALEQQSEAFSAQENASNRSSIDEDLTGAKAEYNDLDAQLWEIENQLETEVAEYMDDFLEQTESGVQIDLVASYCESNEEQNYCRFVTDLYDELVYELSWLQHLYEDKPAFSAERLAGWRSEPTNIIKALVPDLRTLERLKKQWLFIRLSS